MRPAAQLLLLTAALATSLSCSSPPPPCDTDEGMLGESGRTCAEAHLTRRLAETLASRPMDATARGRWMSTLASIDPEVVKTLHARSAEMLARFPSGDWRDRAELRSAELYRVLHGRGLLADPALEPMRPLLKRLAGPWLVDDEHKLIMTETDVEAWIGYASLCREVQGGTPLQLSVADRVSAYRDLTAAYQGADRALRITMLGLGPYWRSARARWQSASWVKQQEWVSEAPLPGPMTGTSQQYLQAILEGDRREHVAKLHEILGPLRFDIPP